MLRNWETEQHGVLEEGPDYWSSQANKHWQGKMWILVKELGKRKKQELEGETEEAMLSSPLQSLSPPPSNGSVPGVAQNPKTNTAVSDESPEISTRPSEVQAGPSQRPLQPTPEHEPDYLSTLTKGQKRTRTEVEGHEEEAERISNTPTEAGACTYHQEHKRPRKEIVKEFQNQGNGGTETKCPVTKGSVGSAHVVVEVTIKKFNIISRDRHHGNYREQTLPRQEETLPKKVSTS
ncbi:hypothetical protein HO133_006182 [Letharia lupina]|uniref:Uncharacterized protein n=1 Tax=Letharia lupina TaxID=560253 RepID=A0A8H6C7Q9_9LECA|nr:uncharacterized protein HO133_006182 [Letharia lupina]KAF6218221.1 hypothetical protein HO133_006182 [Letharia lupina]